MHIRELYATYYKRNAFWSKIYIYYKNVKENISVTFNLKCNRRELYTTYYKRMLFEVKFIYYKTEKENI